VVGNELAGHRQPNLPSLPLPGHRLASSRYLSRPSFVVVLSFSAFCLSLFALHFTDREASGKTTSQRTLMLITKLLNNLMNNVEFGEKESYMTSLNPFISPDNLLLVQQFMQELVVQCLQHPSSHAIDCFV
jgi:hypothetical protein